MCHIIISFAYFVKFVKFVKPKEKQIILYFPLDKSKNVCYIKFSR